jgi:hypothetical protein
VLKVVAHELGHQLGIGHHHEDATDYDDSCAMGETLPKFSDWDIEDEVIDMLEYRILPVCICPIFRESLCPVMVYSYSR